MSSLLDLAEGRWHLFWPDPRRLLSRSQFEAAQYYNDEAQLARLEDDGGQPEPEQHYAYYLDENDGPFGFGYRMTRYRVAVRR